MWRATDRVLGRTVAVKVLHEHLAADERFRARFSLEALAAARLVHPQIVSVYDTGESEGVPFVVMEYLPGGTLQERLGSSGRLPPGEVSRLGASIASALAHAHAEGQVHADIKPSNILFTEHGLPKLSDFGIGKAAAAELELGITATGMTTAGYVAPEYFSEQGLGEAADLYSLGCVLYEALTGRLPFEAPTVAEMGAAKSGQEPAPLRSLRSDAPPLLESAVMRCLARRAADRFPDAHSAALALEESHEEPEPAEPRPPAARGGESFVRSEGRWIIPTVLVVLAAAGLVALVTRLEPSPLQQIGELLRGGEPQGTPATPSSGGSYDPAGEGSENDRRVPLAFDGDDDTFWITQFYTSAQFGGLKDGVGIWFDLGSPQEVSSIAVTSITGGWRGAIRTSEDGRGWNPPSDPEQVGAEHLFETGGSHRYWMIWITSLVRTTGQGTADLPFTVAISEVDFFIE